MWHHTETTNSEGSLEEFLMQFVTSQGDDKLRKKSGRASHTICCIIWGQQTQTVVLKRVLYSLRSHVGTTNAEGSFEERLIQ